MINRLKDIGIFLLLFSTLSAVAFTIFANAHYYASRNDFSGEISIYVDGGYHEYTDYYGILRQEITDKPIPNEIYIVPNDGYDAGDLPRLQLVEGEQYTIYEKKIGFTLKTSYFIKHKVD